MNSASKRSTYEDRSRCVRFVYLFDVIHSLSMVWLCGGLWVTLLNRISSFFIASDNPNTHHPHRLQTRLPSLRSELQPTRTAATGHHRLTAVRGPGPGFGEGRARRTARGEGRRARAAVAAATRQRRRRRRGGGEAPSGMKLEDIARTGQSMVKTSDLPWSGEGSSWAGWVGSKQTQNRRRDRSKKDRPG